MARLVRKALSAKACATCGAVRDGAFTACPCCRKVRCAECAGTQTNWVCQLHRCMSCDSEQLGLRGVGEDLLASLNGVNSKLTRPGTRKVHLSGLACYNRFGARFG